MEAAAAAIAVDHGVEELVALHQIAAAVEGGHGSVQEHDTGQRLAPGQGGLSVEAAVGADREARDPGQLALEAGARRVVESVVPGEELDSGVVVANHLDHHVGQSRRARGARAVGAVEHHVARVGLSCAGQRGDHRRVPEHRLLAKPLHQRLETLLVGLLVRYQSGHRHEPQVREPKVAAVRAGHGNDNLHHGGRRRGWATIKFPGRVTRPKRGASAMERGASAFP